jgi:hypothetical protein
VGQPAENGVRVFDALLVVVGAAIVGTTVFSAVGTVVVPRGVPVRLSRAVFLAVRRVFLLRRAPDYAARDRVFAFYAPVALMLLPGVWLALVVAGFTLIQQGLGVGSWRLAFELSGSSVTTLGFIAADTIPQHVAAFVEAGLGLLLVALLITYLPSMYAGFQRREMLVGRTAIQGGTPPDAGQLLVRFHTIRGLDRLEREVWEPWITGFIDIEETHTSLAALAFFRSTHPNRSWITASGAVLDAASLYASTVDGPRVPGAELCIRSGYLSLRHIADFYGLAHDPEPSPTDPISVTREEYDEVYDRLAAAGVPVKADRDQAWRDFAGWRVNYDTVLVRMAAFFFAPYARWSSDRPPPVAS